MTQEISQMTTKQPKTAWHFFSAIEIDDFEMQTASGGGTRKQQQQKHHSAIIKHHSSPSDTVVASSSSSSTSSSSSPVQHVHQNKSQQASSLSHPALHHTNSTGTGNNGTRPSSIHSRGSSLDAEQSSIHSIRKSSKKRQGKIHKLNPVRLLRRIPAVLSSPPSTSTSSASPSSSPVAEPEAEDVVMATGSSCGKTKRQPSGRRAKFAAANTFLSKPTLSAEHPVDGMEVDDYDTKEKEAAAVYCVKSPTRPLKTITIHQGDGLAATGGSSLGGSLSSLAGNVVGNFLQQSNNTTAVAAANTTTVSFDATHLSRCDVLPLKDCPMAVDGNHSTTTSAAGSSNNGSPGSRLKQTCRRLSLSKKSLPNLLQQSGYVPATTSESPPPPPPQPSLPRLNGSQSMQMEPVGAPFSAAGIPSAVPIPHANTIDVPLGYKREQKRLFGKPSFLRNHPFKLSSSRKSASSSALESISEQSATASSSSSKPPFVGFQNVPLQRFGTIEPAHGAFKTSFLYRLHKQHAQQEHMTIHSFDYKGKNLFDRLQNRLRPAAADDQSAAVTTKSTPNLLPPAGRKHQPSSSASTSSSLSSFHACPPLFTASTANQPAPDYVVAEEDAVADTMTTPKRLRQLLSCAPASSSPTIQTANHSTLVPAAGAAIEETAEDEISASVMTAPAGSKEQQDCLRHLFRHSQAAADTELRSPPQHSSNPHSRRDSAQPSDSLNHLLSLWGENGDINKQQQQQQQQQQ